MDFEIIKGLVSIITPCFNGEKLIFRLLDSVLKQDYQQIEMIVVDDGSMDKSKDVILSYVDKFTNRGYKLCYLYQNNSGQASAINKALPLVKGEFIAWPDCDDYYKYADSITKLVRSLSSKDDLGLVRTLGTYIDEKTLQPLGWNLKFNSLDNAFYSILTSGFCAVPICYMAKASAINKAIPNRHIYADERPQNIQMFEPLTYFFKCVDVGESLVDILVRSNSDSHSQKSISQQLEDLDGYIRIHMNTLDGMDISNEKKDAYKQVVRSWIGNEKLKLCISMYDKEQACRVHSELKLWKVSISKKDEAMYQILRIYPGLLKFLKKIYKHV